MPELPEVETIVRRLRPSLPGQRIRKAEARLPRLLLGMEARRLEKVLRGKTVNAVRRRGKYIALELDESILVVHLGMSGQLTFSPPDAQEDPAFFRTVTGLQKPLGVHPVDPHTHFLLHFESGARLLFRDPRTFGKIFFIADAKAFDRHPRLGLLGPEPLELEAEAFIASFPGWNSLRPVKALLLDQSFLAGIGNIYADEALHLSGLHPSTPIRDLAAEQKVEVLRAVRAVLEQGIRNSGTTFSDYRQPDGTLGLNFDFLRVYGRGGSPCRGCGTRLEKSVVAGRGTVHCPLCQPRPPLTGGKAGGRRSIAKPGRGGGAET